MVIFSFHQLKLYQKQSRFVCICNHFGSVFFGCFATAPIIDFRRREIPNLVPIVLLVSGFFAFPTFWRIMGLIIPAALLLAAAKLTKSEVPGGDFKLICALGFACGLPELAAILFLSGMGAVGYGFIRRLPLKRHIPLCAYVAPAYLALHVIAFALEGGGSM